MTTGNTDAEEAVLNMLQQSEVFLMEDLVVGQPDFSWAQLFLAIDRLSRKNLIAVHRMGMSYEIRLMNRQRVLGHDQQHEEEIAHH